MAAHNVNLQFRAATPDDAEQIRHLVESAFRAIDSRQDWTGIAELASHFRLTKDEVLANIENPAIITLVAVDTNNTNALVASIEASKLDDAGRLSMIAVDERYQQGGLGRRVLAYAEDYCRRTWSVKKTSLNALSTRKALLEWYIRRGYRKTGDTSPFPVDKFEGLALPDDLCFIELDKELTDIP